MCRPDPTGIETKRGPPGSETVLGQYDYNADGLRVRHRLSERGDVDYYYDDNAVIEEHNAADDSLLAHYRYADRLLSLYSVLGTQYYHFDALGSTVNLTTETASVQVSYKLDPWGHIKSQTGTSVNRQIFTGQEHDENTGLIYFGARYYDPDTARFITQDSYLGEQNTPPSLHRYLYYAYSNPTVYIDRVGYASEKDSQYADYNEVRNGGEVATTNLDGRDEERGSAEVGSENAIKITIEDRSGKKHKVSRIMTPEEARRLEFAVYNYLSKTNEDELIKHGIDYGAIYNEYTGNAAIDSESLSLPWNRAEAYREYSERKRKEVEMQIADVLAGDVMNIAQGKGKALDYVSVGSNIVPVAKIAKIAKIGLPLIMAGVLKYGDEAGDVLKHADDIPEILWREGRPSPSNVGSGSGPESISFRDTLSNPYPIPEGQQPVFRREAYAVDTTKLPPGSVIPDGVLGSTVKPPGHVTVNLGNDPEIASQILKDAEIRSLRVKFPR